MALDDGCGLDGCGLDGCGLDGCGLVWIAGRESLGGGGCDLVAMVAVLGFGWDFCFVRVFGWDGGGGRSCGDGGCTSRGSGCSGWG